MTKISVLGLGYIGLPTAIAFAKNGCEVTGYDVNRAVVDLLNAGHIHIVEEGLQEEFARVLKSGRFRAFNTLKPADCYIISVPTPFLEDHEQHLADMRYVMSAAEEVAKVLKPGDLVVLESTVPPLSTRKMTAFLEEKSGLAPGSFYTAHCPERVLPGKILQELIHNDRIIGAQDEASAKKAKELYEIFLQDGKVYTTDDVTAEMCKLVENSFRDVNIAFANELSVYCDRLGIDVGELITLANKHPRVQILSPGIGVGGHCIAVDPWFLVEAFGKDARLIRAAREVNDHKPYFAVEKIEEKLGYDVKKKVGILGLAFKANIDDVRESPSLVVVDALKKKGYEVLCCEPNLKEKEKNGCVLYSLDDVLAKADLLVLAQSHDAFLDRMDEIEKKAHIFFC